jgi:META domain
MASSALDGRWRFVAAEREGAILPRIDGLFFLFVDTGSGAMTYRVVNSVSGRIGSSANRIRFTSEVSSAVMATGISAELEALFDTVFGAEPRWSVDDERLHIADDLGDRLTFERSTD